MRFFVLYRLEALIAHVQYLIAGLQSTVFPGRAVGRHLQNEHPVLEKESFGTMFYTRWKAVAFNNLKTYIQQFRKITPFASEMLSKFS